MSVLRPVMTLPTLITAGALAESDNPIAKAVWQAVKRRQVQLILNGNIVRAARSNGNQDQVYLWLEQRVVTAPSDTLLRVETRRPAPARATR